MRAAVYYGPYNISVREVKKPKVGSRDVLVKIKAAGICGSDLHVYRGKHPYLTPPIIMGHELSGDIVEVGKEVKEISYGARIVVEPNIPCGSCAACRLGRSNICTSVKIPGIHIDGAFAQYISIPEEFVHKVPKNLSYNEAAMIEPSAVAVHVILRSGISIGDRIVILGAGTIGLLALQIARLAGADYIAITDIYNYKLALAKRLGADLTINVGENDPVQCVKEVTEGEGADVVIEAVGISATIQQTIDLLRPGGRAVIVGYFTGNRVPMDMRSLMLRELELIGSKAYHRDYERAIKLVSGRIKVKPLITHEFPLDDVKKAFEILDKRPEEEKAIKLILRP
jgi:2-desacetyl-2-hydroxyethyl bacteriochlorophyllide A dehydrogenase